MSVVPRDATGRPYPVDPRDPQAHGVYEWERSLVEPHFRAAVLSADEVRGLALEASALTDIAPPVVRFAGIALACHADPSTWTLFVADWGRNVVTVLHEMAHLAVHGREPEPHGPVFVGMAIALYETLGGLDGDALAASARRRGLRIGSHAHLRQDLTLAPQVAGGFAGDDED